MRVGIKSIQNILRKATQSNLSFFHSAGNITSESFAPKPSIVEILDFTNTENVSCTMKLNSVENVKKSVIGLTYMDFVDFYVHHSVISKDREYENIWYEILQEEPFDKFCRIYFDVKKLRKYDIELSEISEYIEGETKRSPTFMGIIDVKIDTGSDVLSIINHLKLGILGDKRIKQAEILKDSEGYRLVTFGSSIQAFASLDGDVNTILSNDIRDVMTIFGIEAARGLIVELLDCKGSEVVADFMTRSGEVVPVNRKSIIKYNRGFISAAFFERFNDSIKLFKGNPTDNLESVYSRIFMGLNINDDEIMKISDF